MLDSHCHLTFPQFKDNLAAVLEKSRQLNVTKFLTIGIDEKNWPEALQLTEKHQNVWCALGLHPIDVVDASPNWFSMLKQYIITHPKKVKAIGEIGLDFYRQGRSNESIQKKAFEQQLELAKELKLPVVIHSRDAQKDTLEILQCYAPLTGVIHSFAGNVEQAQQTMEMGLDIGLNGIVTFKNAPIPREVALATPLERLWLETDAPFLAPHPYRGETNDPSYIPVIAQFLADLKGVSLHELDAITTKRVEQVLGI